MNTVQIQRRVAAGVCAGILVGDICRVTGMEHTHIEIDDVAPATQLSITSTMTVLATTTAVGWR